MLSRDSSVSRFLSSHGMHPDSIDIGLEAERFSAEMSAGLRGDPSSSLAMLPAFAAALPKSRLRGRAAFVDAGGTNLRAGLVSFESGEAAVEDLVSVPMPGRDAPVSYSEFCRVAAELLLPYYRVADALGYCFSFPARVLPDGEGEFISVNKELSIEAEPGTKLGAGLLSVLAEHGFGPKPLSLVNDGVAAMLAVPAVTGESMTGAAGFILGTGFNICCSENSSDILKSPGAMAYVGPMAVNVEAAGYSMLPRGDIDRALDAASAAPGNHLLEKMASGAYFGELTRLTLAAAAEEGLLSKRFSDLLPGPSLFTSADASALAAGRAPIDAAGDDAEKAVETARLLAVRAGKAVSVPIVAAKARSCPGGLLTVSAEGSVIKNFDALREAAVSALRGLSEFVFIENATAIGSACAALTKKLSAG